MSSYAKVHLTYVEQVQLLQSRGLHVFSPSAAAEALARHGYYRLAGYWVPFQYSGTHRFAAGSSFDDVLVLYEYDKALRLLILAGLERIEIAIRVRIAHFLGQLDPFALENPSLLDRSFVTGGYATWLHRYRDSVERSTDKFIHDFRKQYGLPLPIWLGIELWDFGMLSIFFSGMRFKHRNILAHDLGLQDGRIMKSWLHSMTVTRNICAHHGRYWNRTLSRPMALPGESIAPQLGHLRRLSNVDSRRQYLVICCIAYLLDKIEPDSAWKAQIIAHLQDFPKLPGVKLTDMGFPENWQVLPLWERKA